MDLTQLANLGEFIGGVAVLVTLVYLAIQVRHGRNELRLGSELDLSGRAAQLSFAYANDPALIRALEIAQRTPEDIAEDDMRRAFMVFTGYFHMIEALYLRSLEGAISTEAWAAHERIVAGLIRSRFGKAWWASRQRFAYSEKFQSFLERKLGEKEPRDYWDVTPPDEFAQLLARSGQGVGTT